MANPALLPRRQYGAKEIRLSVIGFGGIVVRDMEAADASAIVGEAYERGVNYFDVAPSYGNAEQVLGPALEPYRKDCFLACKTGKRDAAGAAAELDQSLKNLRTDHFDLYQLHALSDVKEDVDAVFAKGGAMETFKQARKDGRIRYIGFSAHSEEAAVEALQRYDFDSVLFPVNFTAWHKADFGPRIMAEASKRGIARLALKALARQSLAEGQERPYPQVWYAPEDDPDMAALQLRWTLQQSVTAAIPPGVPKLFRMALDIAKDVRPIAEEDKGRLRKRLPDLRPIFPH